MIFERGKCRVCGCTELRPCAIGGGDGNPVEFCMWMDVDQTVCSNARCIALTPLAVLEQIVARCNAIIAEDEISRSRRVVLP